MVNVRAENAHYVISRNIRIRTRPQRSQLLRVFICNPSKTQKRALYKKAIGVYVFVSCYRITCLTFKISN